jgi:hypothetical protein
MWMEKILFGVLRIVTPMGSRFTRPPLLQRLYLLWIFRHFQMLPLQVLTSRQQRFIDTLCTQGHLATTPKTVGLDDAPVLGTVEWRPQLDANGLPLVRPSVGMVGVTGLAEGFQQHS